MGVRLISDFRRHGPAVPAYIGPFGPRGIPRARSTERSSEMHRFTVSYDGTAGKEGLPAALAANEIWINPNTLQVPGSVDFGLQAMYRGPSTVTVTACMLPGDYATRVGDAVEGATIYAEATPLFEAVATLNPNVAVNLFEGNPAYMLYKLVFGAGAGQVVLTSI